MFPIVELLEETTGRGKKENGKEWIILKYIASCRNKTQQNALKTAEQFGVGEKGKEERRLGWFKQNILTDKIPRQNPTEWTSNKGQECKPGHVKGRVLVRGGG
jgi:hypothetical protein